MSEGNAVIDTVDTVVGIVGGVVDVAKDVLSIFGIDVGGEDDKIKEKLDEMDGKLDELLSLGNDIRGQIGIVQDTLAQDRLDVIKASAQTAKDAVVDAIDGIAVDKDAAINNMRLAVNNLLTFEPKDIGLGIATYVAGCYVATVATLQHQAFASDVNQRIINDLSNYIHEGLLQLDAVQETSPPHVTGVRSWSQTEDTLPPITFWYATATLSDGHEASGFGYSEDEARADAEASAQTHIDNFVPPDPHAAEQLIADLQFLGAGQNLIGNLDHNVIAGGDYGDFVRGEGGNDSLRGGNGDDSIHGGEGEDVLNGDAGNDVLRGDAGDDELAGGTGNNFIDGGEGLDTVSYYGATTGVEVSLLEIDFQVTSSNGLTGDALVIYSQDRLLDVEAVRGSEYADRISGNHDANTLLGGGGNDRIDGLDSNDYLRGDAGDDTLSGGADNDILIGGSGADDLYGGADGDHFRFTNTTDSPTVDLADTIHDFEGAGGADGDLIDLSTIDANTDVADDQAFILGLAAQGGVVLAAESELSDNTMLLAYTDADDVPDLAVRIADGASVLPTTYVEADFIL